MINPGAKAPQVKKKSKIEEDFQKFVVAHPEISCLGLLVILCLFFIFFGLDFNPLLDVNETKYAVISKNLLNSNNWNDLMFNGSPFFEKAPLLFWLEAVSIKFFGEFNAFIVRLPIAILTSGLVFFTYYMGRKIVSRKFGLISASSLVLTSFFMIASHLAVVDTLMTVFITCSIYCGFLATLHDEENEEYYWFFFYLFMGLGFLTKGIFGLIIPYAVIFTYNCLTKNLRTMFKGINLIPGIISLIALTLPWHFFMFKKYGHQFIEQYFLMQNFIGFIDSVGVEQKPFWYFVPIFIIGFMPWTFLFALFLYGKSKAFFKDKRKFGAKAPELIKYETNEQKLVLLSSIAFIIIFICISISGVKLPTGIMPIFPFTALLVGDFWWSSDEKQLNEDLIKTSTFALAAILMITAMGLSLSYYFMSETIKNKVVSFMDLAIIGLYLIGALIIFRLKTNRALSIYAGGYGTTMFFITTLCVTQLFGLIYNDGQNELVGYSSYSNNSLAKPQLVTFDFPQKPSVLLNYTGTADFLTGPDFDRLSKILSYKDGPTFVIFSKDKLNNSPEYRLRVGQQELKLVKAGDTYSLYVKNPTNEFLSFY